MSPAGQDPPVEPRRYTVTAVTRLTGVDRATLVEYCEAGLLPLEAARLEAAEFDDHLVCTIRQIEFLRENHGVNLAGIRMIHQLLAEVERLRRELRFVREGD
jgi:DNA-binding transcriptional MerR regulator